MRSIGRRYRDLRSLSTAYENKMDQQLSFIFDNCNRLKSITFFSSKIDVILSVETEY